jgi:hypothetical protein
MKYLKRFDENDSVLSTEHWCKKLQLFDYNINLDNTVDVGVSVYIFDIKTMYNIPIQFGIVGGSFDCYRNNLLSLKGSPIKVGGSYDCNSNQLISLEGCSEKIGGYFNCGNNKITSLIDGPKEVGTNYYFGNNKIKSLKGLPENFSGNVKCDKNPIFEVVGLFDTFERYKESLDYKYWRGIDIVRGRFKKACDEAGIIMPESIKGYKYIDL